MKRSTPSSFKQPPRKKQKTQSDEIAVLKRKVNKIGRAIEVKWYETSVFQPMNYATSGGVDLALYQRSIVDMGTGDSVLQRDGAKIQTKRIKLSCTFWPQAQQIGPTQVYVTLLRINNVMLVVLFALTILGLEYGVMMEESFTLETLS